MSSDVQLLGRITYQGFAAAWPTMEESMGEFAVRMNTMPKVVVSATLTESAWQNTTVLAGDVPAEVTRLKGQYQGDILVAGSATLVGTLREHDLVDEYRLMMYPVLLGSGKRLFADSAAATDLTLAESRKVGPDVLLLTYRPAGRQPSAAPTSRFLELGAAGPGHSRSGCTMEPRVRAGAVSSARARAGVAAPGALRE